MTKLINIKLTIKKEDGSIYWIENFKDHQACNIWLTEEQTRPYWNDNYTTETEESFVELIGE